MNHVAIVAGSEQVLETMTRTLERNFVGIEAIEPVRSEDDDRLRHEVDELAQLRFAAANLLSHSLVLGHVHDRAEVAFDDAVLEHGSGDASDEDRLAVPSEDTKRMLETAPCRHLARDHGLDHLSVLRMHVRQ